MMNSCYETLDMMGKERYKEKLEPVRFSISNKPYSPSHTKKFFSDISQWQKIKYGHIFAYFISRSGTYTQEQLLLGSSGNADNLPVFPGYHPCSMGMIGSYTTQSSHDRFENNHNKTMNTNDISRPSLAFPYGPTPTSSKRQKWV